MASAGGNIKVVVRVRPFNTRELDRKAKCIVQMQGEQTTVHPPTGAYKPKDSKAALQGPRTFAYDKSYWSFDREDGHFSGQEDLFADLGKPLLDNAFQGYNNCIFAYGQTGSGKSYSMMGFGPEAGVIPRICRDMFDRIEAMQQEKNLACSVEVSYLEIYNERVRDLLNPATKGNLKVREHPSTGPYVEDLAKLVVRSFKEIENLMDEGNKARTVAATNMNETSSRSHAVFTLTLVQRRHDDETNMDMERAAKISLVDLAGSERATSTGATGARLKEGAEINRSLSTLGRVIAALADVSSGKKKNVSLIPYRDSVLTWLLKDSLGGNSLTAMIAAISPADINFEETLSTLRYADSAKRIQNHAVVNEDANARMIRELKEELAQLRSKLGGGANTDGTARQYPPGTPLDQQMVNIANDDGTWRQVSKAEIAEQLSQSEKLYQDLNQTWEQKLQKTEEIQKEREAALEELGISIEKGFIGVSTPKKMPHLVNLSDDPLLAECLVYNLKPGATTVGNEEMSTSAEIRLKGSKILKEHCVFENDDGVVSVKPNDDAAVMVNGMRIEQAKRLRSGYRIILGDFHIFRFNHPQEARAERDEEQGSKLKQSKTADEIDSPSPTDRRRPRSSLSQQSSDAIAGRSPPDSPTLFGPSEHDYDWSFARREAATAILGSDQKISSLTDEELDILFDDLQRVRANRKGKSDAPLTDRDYDSDSVQPYPVRDKHLSTATLDNLSLDTALTAPSTPSQGEDIEKVKAVRDDLQNQSDHRKEAFQEQLNSIETSKAHAEAKESGKADAEKDLQELKRDMERQLQEQKATYEQKLEQLRLSPRPETPQRISNTDLSQQEKGLARWSLEKWSQRKYVRMATHMLQYASLLKEAQILSQQLSQSSVFQYTIVEHGQTLGSSYDMVLNGLSEDDDDELQTSPKPCLAVRVIDFSQEAICIWSIEKLQRRLLKMRQMEQYSERPDYLQHLGVNNPFSEDRMPQFSRVGDAQITLTAVFESRVQDFAVEVISSYSFTPIGMLRLSLEPSLANAPPSTLRFNVVLQDMTGFPEMEGRSLHAQLSVLRASEDEGVTTSQIIGGFGEGPIRFDSLHGMSLPSTSSRDSTLRITIFARIATMHLDKLLSWDDMRDSANPNTRDRGSSRLAESEYRIGERHDVFVQAQILELSESGYYEPVEVLQSDSLDAGAFQLHQGLQRRIMIRLTHTCGQLLPWHQVTSLRAGHVRLLDAAGQVPELAAVQAEVPLKLVQKPSMVDNADGTSNVKIIGQWDSSAHDSVLLDRTTSDRFRVQLSLSWDVTSPRLTDPLKFGLDIAVQVQPRSYLRQGSMLAQLFASSGRIAHSTSGAFRVDIKPIPVKTAMDLWRMDTKYDYVRGEDMLRGWTPRSVSLVRDYIEYRKRQTRAREVEASQSVFGKHNLMVDAEDGAVSESEGGPSDKQRSLLARILKIWQESPTDPSKSILSKQNIEPPKDGAAFAMHSASSSKGSLSASVQFQPKNPVLLKAGHLLTPDETQSRWVRRFVELRLPLLHVYSSEGDELNIINLRDSRVDHQPELAKLLRSSDQGNTGLNVFAVYARQNAFVFAARSEGEKVEWILRIDESYFQVASSGSRTPAN